MKIRIDEMSISRIGSICAKQRLSFLNPLTVFMGANGSGKTTIINCLKLACCSELPAKTWCGNSFPNDQEITEVVETKGEIELKFQTAQGHNMVCIRSFQLAREDSDTKLKEIESVLKSLDPQGEEVTYQSFQHADMDIEMRTFMGERKIVLQNIIFVEEDEANWPLCDQYVLKRKLYDILCDTGRTKQLEDLISSHDERAQEIHSFKANLEFIQTLKACDFKKEQSETSVVEMLALEDQKDYVESDIALYEDALKKQKYLQSQIMMKEEQIDSIKEELLKRKAALSEKCEDPSKRIERIGSAGPAPGPIKWLCQPCTAEPDFRNQEQEIRSFVDEIYQNSCVIANLQRYQSMRNDRDVAIRRLFQEYNLGSLPEFPLSDGTAVDLANQVRSKINSTKKDLLHSKTLVMGQIQVKIDDYDSYTDLEKHEKQKEILDKCKERLEEFLDETIPPDKDISKECIQAQRFMLKEFHGGTEINVVKARNEVMSLKLEIEAANAQLDSYRNTLKSRKRELESALLSLGQPSGSMDSFLRIIETAKENKSFQKSMLDIACEMETMFNPIERVARARHICPCCETTFSGNEEETFVEKLRNNVNMRRVESENANEHFLQLDVLQVLYDECVTTSNDLISLERNLSELTEELGRKDLALDRVRHAFVQTKCDISSVDSLISLMGTSDRLSQVAHRLQEAMDESEKEVDIHAPGAKSSSELFEKVFEYELHAEKCRESDDEVEALFKLISRINNDPSPRPREGIKELLDKQTNLKSKLQSCKNNYTDLVLAENKRQVDEHPECVKLEAQVISLASEINDLHQDISVIGNPYHMQDRLLELSYERSDLLIELDKFQDIFYGCKNINERNRAAVEHQQYKSIEKLCIDGVAKLKELEMENIENDISSKALDKGLMSMCTKKLEDVNKIIEKFWKLAYNGSHINCIRIHSDSTGGGTDSPSCKVLMEVGGRYMEMRGKCSLGEEALASIVMRLAFAEYCNCRIIALDEPAKHLDGLASDKLALFLYCIVVEGKLQLIITTHDERFAEIICDPERTQKVYRLTKDSNHHTIIEEVQGFTSS